MLDQLVAVGLAVETDVVDVDPPQLLRLDRATRPPARAEFGGSDWLNGRTGRCCGALDDEDAAADGDGVADGVAARGGSAAVHGASTTPAAIICASTATRRRKDLNSDESSPLALIRTRPLRSRASKLL